MSIPAQPDSASARGRRDLRLTLLCLVAPNLWLGLLTLLYALAGRHCERGNGALWALALLGLTACAGLTCASLRALRRTPLSSPRSPPEIERRRFQIALGLLLNLLGMLLCIGLTVPLMVLGRCQ